MREGHNDESTIKYKIRPAWHIIEGVQEKIREFIFSRLGDQDISEATEMCATELVENAIKYGSGSALEGCIDFFLRVDSAVVEIVVTNSVKRILDVENVDRLVKQIKESGDPEKLYIDRLNELMESQIPGLSQLGLLRIAYEGRFRLAYTFENNILTVKARREIA